MTSRVGFEKLFLARSVVYMSLLTELGILWWCGFYKYGAPTELGRLLRVTLSSIRHTELFVINAPASSVRSGIFVVSRSFLNCSRLRKPQAPNPKLQGISKLQAPAHVREHWCLEPGVSLELEAWSLELSQEPALARCTSWFYNFKGLFFAGQFRSRDSGVAVDVAQSDGSLQRR